MDIERALLWNSLCNMGNIVKLKLNRRITINSIITATTNVINIHIGEDHDHVILSIPIELAYVNLDADFDLDADFVLDISYIIYTI